MNTKLTTITTQYSKFSDNQVLTKGQLNQFLEYFEDQDHLSRIGLSGVGIVCGFDLSYDSSKKEIYITQGYGVTTDGDLLALVEPKKAIEGQAVSQGFQLVQDAFKTYTHYRNFDDSNARYTPFFSGEDQIELLEIFPGEDIDLTNTTYTNLNTLSQAVLDDKVVLLYLENYPKQGDLCTALDCDNQGIEQVARLRVLLVSSDDAKTITGYDPIYNEHDWHEYYLALPEIAVRRDILTEDNTKDFIGLKQNYYKLIKDYETLADLSLGLDVILQKFGREAISSNISSLFDISPSAVPIDFQYHYDVLKDLVDTYTEIKRLLLHLNVHCCPSIGSFPKHLLLGRLKESQMHYKSLRHRFYKSPIIGHEDTNLKRVHSLLNRVVDLVDSYLKVEKGEDIKITPSLLQGMLGTKAIPFYYDLDQAFLNHWSYDKSQNFIQTSNVSYHTALLSPSLSIQQPLLYDLDNYNFLRIEGIQGKSYRDALDQVLTLKKDYGLSFDVKVLSLNPTTKDIDLGEYRCEFEDLNVLLKAWTTEQECILASMASFFSGFTTDKVGENIKEIEYTQGRKVIGREVINTDVVMDKTSEVVTKREALIDRQRILLTNKQTSINKKTRLPYDKNVIDESLTVEEKTIGRYMKEAIEENKKGSVNDIKNATRSKLEALLSTEEWIAKPGIRDFIYNDVVDLLSVTYILSERIPQTISEIDTGNIDTYELTLEEVCQLVRALKVTYQTIDLEDTLKDILGLLINQLSFVCCSGEKLTILLNEIETRKEEILKQLQLSEFVKKHPGLRHYAGVPVGGTFVMAYLTDNAEDRVAYEPVRLKLNFLEQPNIDDDGTDGDEGIIKLWDRRISTRFAFLHKVTDGTQNPRNEIVMIGDSLQKTVSNLADFLNNIWRVAGLSHKCKATTNQTTLTIELLDQNIRKRENFIQFYNPAIVNTNNKIFFDENEIIIRNVTAKNTVIADFALPYMCCSDCAPVNFIIPKEPVSLSLPTPFICLDDSTTPIPFTVSPKDGEVKAIVEGEISGGVTQNEEGAYLFDATLLDASLYGTAIRFTVNDEETIAVITVYQNPQPVVTVLEEDFNYNDARTEVEVFFEVTGTGINANSVFAWDFGDGTQIVIERPDSDGIVNHVYALPIASNNTVFPRLTVTNELCSDEVILEGIVFQDPIVSLTIEELVHCVDPDDDRQALEIPFNVQPENATVTVNGEIDGIGIDDNLIIVNLGEFSAYDTPITFSINGEAQSAPEIIILNKSDFADFTCEPENTSVPEGTEIVPITFEVTGLTDEQKEELGFNWDFGDEEDSSEIDLIHNYKTSSLEPGTHTFSVILVIEGGPCGFVEIRKDIKITITNVNHILQLDENEVCIDREIGFVDVGFQVTPIAPMTVEGNIPGVSVLTDTINIQYDQFDSYGIPLRFIIDGEVIDGQELIVRERPTNAVINSSPNTLSVERGTTTVTVNFSIAELTPQQETEVTATWDFGDGNTSTLLNPSHDFTIPANPDSPVSFNVSVTLSTSSCEAVTLPKTIIVDITEPDITFNLDTNDVCFEAGTNAVVTEYTLSPNADISVEGNATGISINRTARTIRLTTAFTRFNTPIRFVVNEDPTISETLIVRRKPVNINFSWSPTSIQLVDGQEEITITFTAINYNTSLYPGTSLNWSFEGGQKAEGQDAQVPFMLSAEQMESNTFSINTILTVSGNGCDDFTTDVPEVVVTLNNEESKSCNEMATTAILNDRNGLPTGDNIPSKIKTDIVDPTIRLYDVTIIPSIGDYLSGNKNENLTSLFPTLITTTANTLFQINNSGENAEFIVPISKYFIGQIKLFYHLLHCQEEFTNESAEIIDFVVNSIAEALGTLSNMRFDMGDPDPTKPEGSLREFLIECFNDPRVSPVVKNKMEDLIAIIIPV